MFAQRVTMVSELEQLSRIDNLPTFRSNTVIEQVSTCDPTGGNDDGFNGTYSYIRKNADGSLVLFDQDGPGVLSRIATPTPSSDTLDFYIDFSKKPALTITYADLFSGKVFPFVAPLCDHAAGGSYAYFPIPFLQHLQIVSRGKQEQFHQFQYRLFPHKTTVESFHLPMTAEEKKSLEAVGAAWQQLATVVHNDRLESKKTRMPPGDKQIIFSIATGARIEGIELGPTMDFHIKIFWDHDSVPAIDCPVADFFGHGFDGATIHGLLAGRTNGQDYFYFPMPFDKSARIELANGSSTTQQLVYRIYYNEKKRNPNHEGKLYTSWSDHDMPQGEKHILLNAHGKGHLAGTFLWTTGRDGSLPQFFEGDDSTATDGVFRIHGTGSEDYFNGGWYDVKGRWDTLTSKPLSGCLGYHRTPVAHTGGYRFLLSDKISFEKSIYQAIEHGPTLEGVPARYRSVTFYYLNK